MARNFRCVLFGLIAFSAVCYYVFTRSGMRVVMRVAPDKRPARREGDQHSSSASAIYQTYSTNSGSSACPQCKCSCDGDKGHDEKFSASETKASNPQDHCRNVTPGSQLNAGGRTRNEPLGANVVIMSSMRTGSSFIGEIFGRNEEVFYLFEPGLALLTELHSKGALFVQPLYTEMLDLLYRCNVTTQDFYIRWMNRQPPPEILKKVPRLFEKRCLPNGNTGLRCDEISAELFMQVCLEKRNIAIKSIRVWDIGMLSPLIQDSSVNLKVIHLVRDPRGMIASRVIAMNVVDSTSNLGKDKLTGEMHEHLIKFCSHSIDNKEVGYYLPKYRENYFLLRYEDMSLDPVGVTQRIYDFVGLGAVPEGVSKWLAENTNAEKPGLYSTSRVSNKAYQSWRTSLNFETAKAIEKVGRCAEMMKHFGYLPVKDELHLKNLSSSLALEIPPAHDFARYQP